MKRLLYFDFYRLVLSCLVFFIHFDPSFTDSVCQKSLVLGSMHITSYCYMQSVARIAVPSFFMLAGYFFSFPLKLYKCLNKSVALFLICFCVIFFYLTVNDSRAGLELLFYSFKSVIASTPYYHLWFISFLAYFYLLLALLAYLAKCFDWSNNSLFCGFTVISILMMYIANQDGFLSYQNYTYGFSAFYVIPFFTLGFCVKHLTIRLSSSRSKLLLPLIGMVNILFASLLVAWPSPAIIENYYWFPTIYLASSILFCVGSYGRYIDEFFLTQLKIMNVQRNFHKRLALLDFSSLPLVVYLSHVQVIYLIRSLL